MDLICIVSPLILIMVVGGGLAFDRWSVPAILVALGGGILFGSDCWASGISRTPKWLTPLPISTGFHFVSWRFGIQRREFKRALPAGGMATWGSS